MTDPGSTNAALRALDGVRDSWMQRNGVVAVEVARRWVDGAPTDEVGIRVTVEEILPPEDIPEGEAFPETLDGIPVDVVEGAPPVLE